MNYRLKSYSLVVVLTVLGLALVGSTATAARADTQWPPVNGCSRQVSYAGVVLITCTLTGPWFEMTGNATVAGYRLQWTAAAPTKSYSVPAKTVGKGFWLPAVNSQRVPALAPVFAQSVWKLAILAIPPAGVDGAAINLVIWTAGPNGKMRIRVPYIAGQSPQNPQPLTPVVI